DPGHVDRALMMRDHAPHEGRVGVISHDAFHHWPVHGVHGIHIVAGELWGVPVGCFHSGGLRCIGRTVHHPALHHLLHGAHALGRHGLHHGPHLVRHTRHRHRRSGGWYGLFLRLSRVVGI